MKTSKWGTEKKIMVSLRMPPTIVKEVKLIALNQSKPYQVLMREWISEKIHEINNKL